MNATYFKISALIMMLIAISVYSNQNLRLSDPQKIGSSSVGTLKDIVITVKPHATYSELELFLTITPEGSIYSSRTDTLEATLQFRLNEKAFINDLWLFLDDTTYVIGELMDKWTAGYLYEGVVQRALDPSILYKKNSTNYEMKVYPLFGDSYRTVKINYFVPNEWSKIDIKTLLPFDFKNVSYKPIETIDVIVYPDSIFTNPQLENSMNVNFTYTESDRYGNCYRGKLNVNLGNSPAIIMEHKLKDSIFVSVSEFENENYYQAILPLENHEIYNPKKFLFLLDYEVNKSNYSKDEIIQALKKTIIDVLYDQDAFNIFYSSQSNQINQLNYDWIKADKESINAAFGKINQDSLKDGTNLENLLLESANWIKNQPDNIEVMIISNSDSHGSMEIANELGPKFLETIGSNCRISVASYLQKNWKSNVIFGIGYAANDYLYNGLIRLSQGFFTKIFDFQHNPELLFNRSISNISGGYAKTEFAIQPTNGFAYDQFKLIDESNGEYKFYAEAGKFNGSLPINLVFTGFFRDTPFQKTYHFSQSEEKYDNKSIWAGSRINSLENENGSQNMMIYKIINESLKYHVLSIFTAFLALDDFEKHHLDKDNYIPVEFLSFEGEIVGNKAVLTWATASEKNNYGFYIDRSSNDDSEWQNIGFVSGAGTTNNTNYYNFTDSDIQVNNTYNYRLRQTDIDGTIALSPNVVTLGFDKVFNFVFEQNYPNPAEFMTTFKFSKPIDSYVKLEIFDLYGNSITTLVDRNLDAGDYNITWECKYENGEQLSAGLYFAKLSVGTESKIIKLIVR